jgi:EAL domain-containing protein (putative c-di-GMP-specific phosphodiesterase class I)
LAISDYRIVPYFQPVFAADTGTVWGYEVLGRKVGPEGVESLGPFFHDPHVPGEEKLAVDRTLRRRALERFKRSGLEARLLLNIQPQWLIPLLTGQKRPPTLQILEELDLPAERIVIEISETEFAGDLEQLAELIANYRAAGCGIAVDDLGSGLSNLDRVSALRPDLLKVGGTLVTRAVREEATRYLLRALGGFAERAGSALVIEGVESPNELRLGLEAGARFYQGYLLGRPRQDLVREGEYPPLLREECRRFALEESQLESWRWAQMRHLEAIVADFSEANAANLAGYLRRLVPRLPPFCLRAYVCARNGEQVTPNYERVGDTWVEVPEFLGRNWCWRPYFVGAVAAAGAGRPTVSESYLDLHTRRRVWTFCRQLGKEWFLFIDVGVDQGK